MQTNDWDILIKGGTLLPMSEKMEIIENPLVGIKDGIIVTVEANDNQDIFSGSAKEKIDASGCIIMPGLPRFTIPILSLSMPLAAPIQKPASSAAES